MSWSKALAYALDNAGKINTRKVKYDPNKTYAPEKKRYTHITQIFVRVIRLLRDERTTQRKSKTKNMNKSKMVWGNSTRGSLTKNW